MSCSSHGSDGQQYHLCSARTRLVSVFLSSLSRQRPLLLLLVREHTTRIFSVVLSKPVCFPSRSLTRACGARLIYLVVWNRRFAPVLHNRIHGLRGEAARAPGERERSF